MVDASTGKILHNTIFDGLGLEEAVIGGINKARRKNARG